MALQVVATKYVYVYGHTMHYVTKFYIGCVGIQTLEAKSFSSYSYFE